MRLVILALPVALAACPAPDPFDLSVEPEIELLYPPRDEPLIRQADGTVEFLVVVDMDGIEFNPEGIGDPPVVGQGHYHVWVESEQVAAPTALSYAHTHEAGDSPDLTSANQVHIRVSLQHNDHSDYDDPDNDGVELERWESIIAYDIVDE